MANVILKKGFLDKKLGEKIAELIIAFQKINIPKGIDLEMDFNDVNWNIKELKKRKNKNIVKIENEIKDLKSQMERWHRIVPHVIVHGDINPFNILLLNSRLFFIDFEHVFQGDYLTDPAMFMAHLMALEYQGLTKEACKNSQDNFLQGYLKTRGNFNENEQERFNAYLNYSNHFIMIHRMAWS